MPHHTPWASEMRIPQVLRKEGVIPTGATRVIVRADRSTWANLPAHDVLEIKVDMSIDNGATWTLLIGFTAAGGEYNRRGRPLPEPTSWAERGVPHPDVANRRYRIVMDVKTLLRTRIDIEWT